MKQALCALILFFSSVLAFSQTRAETYVYILDILTGSREEQRALRESMESELRAAGYTVTENILAADYALNCSIGTHGEGSVRLLELGIFDAQEEQELISTEVSLVEQDSLLDRLPFVVSTLFARVPLKKKPEITKPVTLDPEIGAAVVGSGGGGSTGDGSGNAGPSDGDSSAIASTGGSPSPSPTEDAPPDDWKYQWLYLDGRVGISNRYYLSNGGPNGSATIFTFDVGIEPEIHFHDFLAFQFGLNFAMDKTEYSNPNASFSTYLLSIPFMFKYLINTPRFFTTGFYFGGYTTFDLMGPADPPPFGLLGGVDFTVKVGPGALLFDIRFSGDIDGTDISNTPGYSYDRMFLTLSAGYKFGFIPRTR